MTENNLTTQRTISYFIYRFRMIIGLFTYTSVTHAFPHLLHLDHYALIIIIREINKKGQSITY